MPKWGISLGFLMTGGSGKKKIAVLWNRNYSIVYGFGSGSGSAF